MGNKPPTEAERLARVNEITAETEKVTMALDLVRRQLDSTRADEELAMRRHVELYADYEEAFDATAELTAKVTDLVDQEDELAAELAGLEQEAAELLKLEPSDLDGTAVDEPLEEDEALILERMAEERHEADYEAHLESEKEAHDAEIEERAE